MPLLDGITADLEKFVQGREDNRDVKRKGDVEKEWLCQDSQPSKREVNKSWHV